MKRKLIPGEKALETRSYKAYRDDALLINVENEFN